MNGRIAPIDPVQRIEHRRVHDRGNAAGVLRRSASDQGHAKHQLVPIGHDVRTRRRRHTEESTSGQDPERVVSSNPHGASHRSLLWRRRVIARGAI
jgi:hypothetical protein